MHWFTTSISHEQQQYIILQHLLEQLWRHSLLFLWHNCSLQNHQTNTNKIANCVWKKKCINKEDKMNRFISDSLELQWSSMNTFLFFIFYFVFWIARELLQGDKTLLLLGHEWRSINNPVQKAMLTLEIYVLIDPTSEILSTA